MLSESNQSTTDLLSRLYIPKFSRFIQLITFIYVTDKSRIHITFHMTICTTCPDESKTSMRQRYCFSFMLFYPIHFNVSSPPWGAWEVKFWVKSLSPFLIIYFLIFWVDDIHKRRSWWAKMIPWQMSFSSTLQSLKIWLMPQKGFYFCFIFLKWQILKWKKKKKKRTDLTEAN